MSQGARACAERTRSPGSGVRGWSDGETERRGEGERERCTQYLVLSTQYLIFAVAALAACLPQLAVAQQPVIARVSDQPEVATQPPPLQEVPELPETIVSQRLGNFPSEPLPSACSRLRS